MTKVRGRIGFVGTAKKIVIFTIFNRNVKREWNIGYNILDIGDLNDFLIRREDPQYVKVRMEINNNEYGANKLEDGYE